MCTETFVFYFAGEMVLGIYILGIKLWDEGLCFTCLCVCICVGFMLMLHMKESQ